MFSAYADRYPTCMMFWSADPAEMLNSYLILTENDCLKKKMFTCMCCVDYICDLAIVLLRHKINVYLARIVA